MGYDIEKEKREAIEAGRRALNSLSAAKENLNSAKNWGLVDMFGGGFFSTMLKHSKMDHAKQNMDQAKYDLRNFSRELNDVNMACDLHIDTGDFLSFADYFFDGFVVDWMVQDRINTAKSKQNLWQQLLTERKRVIQAWYRPELQYAMSQSRFFWGTGLVCRREL